VFVVAFLGVFVATGCGIGYLLSFRPLFLAYRAHSWTPTDCDVIGSRVAASGRTARADIQYRYSVDGRPYTSNRYNFIPGATNDSTVDATVQQYAPGTRFQCYVDPADPTEAVINRDVTGWYYLGLVFFAAFAGIPLLIGTFVVRAQLKTRVAQRMAENLPPGMRALDGGSIGAPLDAGPLTLHPSVSPIGKLVAATIVALIWNGLVGVFTYFEINTFMTGSGSWGLAIFLLIFQLIGVGLLVSVPYQLLALANPRPTITLGRSTVALGAAVPFEWQLDGAASRVTHLTITLLAREETRYRRGTDTRTDKHEFHREVIAESSDPMGIAHGSGTIRLPATTMHSFTATNNKIIWTIQVTGEIRHWPDVDDSFDITVSPA
jgi:Protein of unknown function (DUF3592)